MAEPVLVVAAAGAAGAAAGVVATGVDFVAVEDELAEEEPVDEEPEVEPEEPAVELEAPVEVAVLFRFFVVFLAAGAVVEVAVALGVAEVLVTGTETTLLALLVSAPPVRGVAAALNPVEV